MAARESPDAISPVTKKHVGNGAVLTFRWAAEVAWDVGRDRGCRDEEGECGNSNQSQGQSQIPASHVSEGSPLGRISM